MMKQLALFISFFCLVLHANAQYNKGVEVIPILRTDTNSIGQKIKYPQFLNDEVTIAKVIIHPGKSTGWHKHTFPVFAYVLKGNLTVEIENHKTLEFSENRSFAEVINTKHNGINNGTKDVVLIAFFMGEKGKPLSEH
ncbi:MAG: cupin domain-containing protein [Bacteroidales bacterium]|nr:cupin domain-containing protein [Bacteroidales bacterium]